MGKLGEIFRAHGPEYRNRFDDRMSLDQLRAMADIEACHTSKAGAALWRCTRCGNRHFTYVGCGNRHCPGCGRTGQQQWLRNQSALLLPGVTYHLVTFTVPKELRRMIRSHPRALLEQLMRTASSTLLDLCNNPKWVGGTPGLTAVLHTWTRQYEYHPHVHFITTGGGLGEDGRWRSSHPDYLVPVPALSVVFRARFRDALKADHPDLFASVPPEVWRRDWVVHSEPVGSGQEAYAYLARYLHRVALTESAILRHDEKGITVCYRKSGSNRPRTMTLVPMEFLRRFLQHVLPSRFCKVRHYGLHHSSKRGVLALLRSMLAYQLGLPLPDIPPEVEPVSVECPRCQAAMRFVKRYGQYDEVPRINALPRGPP